jgi:hypothetical protein
VTGISRAHIADWDPTAIYMIARAELTFHATARACAARSGVKRLLLLTVVAACSSGSSKQEAAPAPVAVEKAAAADPWAVGDRGPSKPGPAAGNLNKLVIGGDNANPQMGLFALKPADAARVDAEMEQGLEPAYRLAEKLAVGKWTGDRTFCEDSVRLRLGYFGIDGGMNDEKRERWKTKQITQRDIEAINGLHEKMIGEKAEAACAKSIETYVAGFRLAATKDLELRNFGY